MFIISWNVAGWSSTSKMIKDDFGSIAEFLHRTQADIVCLQEVKGSWAKLETDPCSLGASDTGSQGIKGWESFWSFSNKTHRGFNGVATFVRKGFTLWGDSRPLQDEELDNEGRVIVTCHSHFVIINTYVVNARNGLRIEYKMKFLQSIKKLLLRLKKETGKPIILLGDLNQTYRTEDAYWCFRRLSISTILQLSQRAKNLEENNKEWEESFPYLSISTLQRLENFIAEQISLTILDINNSLENNDRHSSISVDSGAILDLSNNNNNNNNTNSMEQLKKLLRERLSVRNQQKDNNTSNNNSLATLTELYEAGVQNVCVDMLRRPVPSTHNRELFTLTQYCGLPPHADVSCKLLKEIISELHLYDSLLFQPPNINNKESSIMCPCPYTCWDQSRNKRQTNEGTRIDYIFIEEELTSFLVPCQMTENNIGISSNSVNSSPIDNIENINDEIKKKKELLLDFFSEFDGYAMNISANRAMAAGAYPIAPFDGSGLPPLTETAKDIQFIGLPSTGMFITPPQYSDHCGICVYFKGISLTPRSGKIEERHRCLYRPPTSLESLFAKHTRSDVKPVKKETLLSLSSEEKKNSERKTQVRRLENEKEESDNKKDDKNIKKTEQNSEKSFVIINIEDD